MKRKEIEKKDSRGRQAGTRQAGRKGMVLKRKATAQHGVSSSYSGFINIAVSRGGGAVQAENPACGEEEFSNGCGWRAGRRAGAGGGKYLL